jgi:hypothetical protein
MAIQFPDRNPTATSNDKTVHTKVVQLTFADFVTGGVASSKAVLPADSTILGISYWKKTAFSGGGVTAATLSVGVPGTPTNFVNAFDVNTPAAGTRAIITPVSNIMQNYQIPQGPDIQLLFTGTATTGNPTAGELYVEVRYVR